MMKISLEKSQYHRFSLIYDYSQDKVEFCRDLKESFGWRKFSFETFGSLKRWVFSDSLFVPIIKEKFPEVEIDPAVSAIVSQEQAWTELQKVKAFQIDSVKNKTTTDFEVKGLKGKLYDYQRVGVEFLVTSGGRAIIADACGVGKTLQALAFIKHQKFQRVLVVCPASVKFSWEGEINKWTNLSSVVIDSQTDISKIDPDTQIWIINYDILKKHLAQLTKTRFDCIVGDECQWIKNLRAQRTKAFRLIAQNVPSVVLLSGTPLLSRPSELFSILNIINPNEWSNFYEYARRYCAMRQTRWGMDFSGASHVDELHERIKNYFIRRNKTEVLKELPPKNFIDIPVKLDKEYASQYDTAARSLAEYLRRYSGKQPPEIARTLQAEKLGQLNVLRQLNALGKVKVAQELIESILDGGEKVLVFSSFVEPLKQLEEYFGDKAVILTGETSVGDRKGIVESFQKNPNIKVFLGGIKSAGVGITLTEASNVVFLDYSWNPADHQQAQDRCHRPGQVAESIGIYQLFAKGTIDEDLKETLKRKQKIFDKVIEGEEIESSSSDALDAAVKRVLENYQNEEK